MASSNTRYKYYQPNEKDLKDQYGDCVVRSLAKVRNADWLTIYDELIPIAREKQCMPNGKPAYEQYLKEHGFVYHGISNKKGSKRPTVQSFTLSHKNGTFVLRTAHHLVASVDGYFFDTWDSGNACLYGYWEGPN